jgi:hypothetical protein
MALQLVGYPPDDRSSVLRAFHHHYRGLDGDVLDDEDLRILYALSRQLQPAVP